MDSEAHQKCKACSRVLELSQFYKRHDRTIFPVCKGCLLAHFDALDFASVLHILRELNIPFVLDEWVSLVERNKENSKLVLGKYLAKMKLKGWKGFTYKDTYRLNEGLRRFIPPSSHTKEQLVRIAENILSEFGQTE